MSRVIFDAEANGYLEEATECWCICTINPDTGERYSFVHASAVHTVQCNGTVADGIKYIDQFDEQIAHNGIGYDWPLFKKLFDYEYKGLKTDSLLVSKLAEFDRRIPPGCKDGPHSVDAWGIRFQYPKPKHEEWDRFSPEMLVRCQTDVEIQWRLWAYCLEQMNRAGNWDFAVWLEHEFAKIIQRQNHRGWNFAVEKAQHYVNFLGQYMEELHAVVAPHLPTVVIQQGELKKPLMKSGAWAKAVRVWAGNLWPGKEVIQDGEDYIRIDRNTYRWSIGGPFSRVDFQPLNIGSDKQLKEWLLTIGWRPLEWNVSKKTHEVTGPKLTEESLDSLTVGVGPQIAQWLKCKHRKSMIEGFLKKVRIDGTLECPSNPLGTPTGRQTHKTVVNIPGEEAYFGKELRDLFIARPGYVVVGGDSASCQARALCHYMQDDRFTDSVINGKKEDGTDLHSFNMRMTGVANRKLAKNFFYGFIFGAQAAKIGTIIGSTKQAGQALMDQYFSNLPGLKSTIDDFTKYWGEHGHIIGIDGRTVRVRKKHEILCYALQLLEAVSMKLAAILVDVWATNEGIEHHMLIHYHDEIQYEVRPDQAERFKEIFHHAIIKAGELMNLNVPLDGEVQIGQSWGDCH